jgi:HEAT repeat protein/predicted negative regulator of RcsB-dependent stress response
MRAWIISTLSLLLLVPAMASAQDLLAGAEAKEDPYWTAQELEKRGKDKEAFLKYLRFPGGEHAALKLARPKAKDYLELLRVQGKDLPLARFKLIEGDLLLALGERAEALACYRAVAGKIGKTSKETWDKGFLPWDQYFVEVPPLSPRDDLYAYGRFIHQAQQPFALGPGSHRDNWLLRRFLALEAWHDAGREFERLWDFHLRYSEAYLVSQWEEDPAKPNARKMRDYVVRESGFSSLGLLFSLDYAFFWKQRKDNDKALAILRETLVRLHLDDYQDMWDPELLDPEDRRDYPRQLAAEARGKFGFGYGYGEGAPAGITAKEFLRLAYGEFKTAGREARLVETLQAELKLGKNRLRRVLARIRLHEGKTEEALKLELAYLTSGRFDELTRARRRGRIFEDFQKLAEAVTEYEKVLAALPKQLKPEEERVRDDALDRLLALYASLGQTQKVLDLSLRQFDLGRPLSVPALEQAAQVYGKAGQGARFTAWVKKRREEAKNAHDRASLSWLLKDYGATIKALTAQADPAALSDWRERHAWQERFAKQGMEREYLKALVAVRPQELDSRWRLLVLEDRTKGPEAIEVMEQMLATAARRDGYVPIPKYVYPLARLYEQHGHLDKLVRLGQRILQGQKPFEDINHYAYGPRSHGVVGYEEQEILVDSLLIVLPHLKNAEDFQAFDKVARHWSRWSELTNQLARRRDGDKAQRHDPFIGRVRNYAKVSVQTVGLPAGARMLAARDDVHTISANGQWVGTSWGLVRYRERDKDTLDIVQVPLGAPVTDILETPAGLFVATAAGLFRLDEPNGDTPRPVRIMSLEGEPFLTWWRDQVWVEIPHHVLQYDPKMQQLRDHHEPDRWQGGEWRRSLVVAGDTLWSRQAVFDETTGEFQPLRHDGDLRILGGVNGEVWASVTLPKYGTRPALVDPKSRTVKVLPIANIKAEETHTFHTILGADKDHVWFGHDGVLVYHRRTGEIKLVRPPEHDEKRAHRGPAFWHHGTYRGLERTYAQSATSEGVPGLTPYRIADVKHAPGKILVGAAKPHFSIDDGGLFVVDPKTLAWTKVGHAASELAHPRVNKIVFDDDTQRAYVCTDGGVTILSLPGGNVIGRLTVSDGLSSNRVTDVLRVGRKLCFACAPFYTEGGVAVLDEKTGMVQRFSRRDGLPSHHIKKLRAEGDKVHVLFDTFLPSASWQHHHDRSGTVPVGNRITFKSAIFDVKTGKVVAGNEILEPPPETKAADLPFLGGAVTVDVTYQGKRYLGGEGGLLILDEPKMKLDAAWPTVAVEKVLTRRQRWQAEAKALTPRIATPDDLAKLLRQENPLVREKAMDFVPEEGRHQYLAVLQQACQDDHVPVRRKAAELLKTLATPETIAGLKPLLTDPDRIVRANAAIGLARGGSMPELKYFKEALRTVPSLPNLDEVYDVLARQGSTKALALLLEHGSPHDRDDGTGPPEYLKVLGEQVQKNAALADLLLKAYDPEPPEDSFTQPTRQVEIVAQVFQAAGKPMLPVLYKALASPDRVVRSNAARACGAIGDLAAVPHLVKALDLESGLSRASIVEALGRLKAKDALPDLIKLYVDTVNDDWAWGSPSVHHSGAGFRSSQMGVSQAAMYQFLSDLDALKSAWEDLKSTARRPPRDPRRHENLLTADHLLEAIRDIGPENSPAFYRALAGDRNAKLRHEAAIHLAAAAPKDLDKSLAILRNLAGDQEPEVQMAATVSLHILKQPDTEKAMDTWLSSPEYELKRLILVALDRIEHGERLAFARAGLRAIAADATLHSWLRERAGQLLQRIEREKTNHRGTEHTEEETQS